MTASHHHNIEFLLCSIFQSFLIVFFTRNEKTNARQDANPTMELGKTRNKMTVANLSSSFYIVTTIFIPTPSPFQKRKRLNETIGTSIYDYWQ